MPVIIAGGDTDANLLGLQGKLRKLFQEMEVTRARLVTFLKGASSAEVRAWCPPECKNIESAKSIPNKIGNIVLEDGESRSPS